MNLSYFYRPSLLLSVFCFKVAKNTRQISTPMKGGPGLIFSTLNQSRLANHFLVSRWENNKADQSRLHSFLMLSGDLLHSVSCITPQTRLQRMGWGKEEKQGEFW